LHNLCDNVGDYPPYKVWFQAVRGGVRQGGKCNYFVIYLDCPVLFCHVLTFLSILCPGRTAWPIFTPYCSNDVFPCKKVPFGV